MTRIFLSMLAAVALLTGAAAAQERPVVVELFTSQGCSSCPPADAYLHKLAARDDVIALSLHVDYWDYIGWKDEFANPAFTARQRGYARTNGRTMVYTPQMIINGSDHVVGNRPKDVEELITTHRALPVEIGLRAQRNGGKVKIDAEPKAEVQGPLLVQLVTFRPENKVKITRGENAGKTLSYANVVTAVSVIKSWNGRAPLSVEAALNADQSAVVLIQKKGHGGVLAAARVN